MPFKVLLAEDNAVNRAVIESYLDDLSVSLTMVENGQQAIESLEKEQFDLILMDLEMPVMGGKEAVKKLRDSGVKTPVLAFSAHSKDKELQSLKSIGFNGFIEKPINEQQLRKSVDRFRN